MLSASAAEANIFAGMSLYQQMDVPSKVSAMFRWVAASWFAVFFAGQWIFAAYIIMRYWQNAWLGQYERWNMTAPGLYVKGAPFRSAIFGMHAVIAALVSMAGPIQVIPAIRQYAPRLHRVAGRVYVCLAFIIALDGIVLVWRRGAVGGDIDHSIVTMNALIILLCAFFTIRTARKRDIPTHNRWALRLLLAMSGVWFFRVYLMLWLTINSKPVGFDPMTFTGPFLTILGVLVHIFPQVLISGYFGSRDSSKPERKLPFSLLLIIVTVGMAIGLYAAITRMWLPRLIH